MTDNELKTWNREDLDISNALHIHFEKWGRWDWCDIAEEARRVNNLMFGEAVDEGSALDAITTAAVAHANHTAYEAMAAALGVNADDLEGTIKEWSEYQDDLPPPVTAARLMEMIGDTKKEWEESFGERSTGNNQTRG